MRTVQEEDEWGTVAFCGSTSRCVDGGHNPVWFHFKRSGRDEHSLWSWCAKSDVCSHVCVNVWWYHQQYFSLDIMRVFQNVLARLFFLRLGFTANRQRKMVCKTHAGDTKIY